MKVFVKIILWASAIFSVGAILFRLGIIPPLFGSSDNADNINDVIINLSYSYLAGLIFYLLNDYLPSLNRRKTALELISPKLLSLYSKMDHILAISKLEEGLDKENGEITLEDCKFANTASLEDGRVAVKVYIRINSNEWSSKPTSEWYEKINSQSTEAESIKKLITEIESSSVAIHLDNELMDLLYQIKTSGFLSDVNSKKEMKKITKVQTPEMYNGQQNLYDYIKLLLKLKTYDFDKHEHKIVKMSPEEEAEYAQFQKDMAPIISAIMKQTGKFKVYKGSQQIK